MGVVDSVSSWKSLMLSTDPLIIPCLFFISQIFSTCAGAHLISMVKLSMAMRIGNMSYNTKWKHIYAQISMKSFYLSWQMSSQFAIFCNVFNFLPPLQTTFRKVKVISKLRAAAPDQSASTSCVDIRDIQKKQIHMAKQSQKTYIS